MTTKLKTVMMGIVLGMTASKMSIAHGGMNGGPNGGYVRMPGAFHTELVPEEDGDLRVYLLDIDLKNPTTQKSNVKVSLNQKGKETELSCQESGTFFTCEIPKNVNVSAGDTYIVKGSRNGAVGGNAVYELPLRLGNY